MTAELESTRSELAGETTTQRSQPSSISRRVLIRGMAVTVPTVLTLHSGAALAMSSNLIRTAVGAQTDPDGNYLCLDTSSTYGETRKRGVYDLGSPAHGEVTAIPSEREYFLEPKDDSRSVTGPEMCDRGGTYYYKGTGSTGGSYGGTTSLAAGATSPRGRFGGEHDGWIGGEGSERRDVFGDCDGLVRGQRRHRHPGNLTRHERLALRFRAVSPSECLWGHWGGDHVVFHRPSGKTHLLNEPSALLMTQNTRSAAWRSGLRPNSLPRRKARNPSQNSSDYVAGLLSGWRNWAWSSASVRESGRPADRRPTRTRPVLRAARRPWARRAESDPSTFSSARACGASMRRCTGCTRITRCLTVNACISARVALRDVWRLLARTATLCPLQRGRARAP